MRVERTWTCAKAMRDRTSRLSDPYQFSERGQSSDQAIGVPFLLGLFFGQAKKRSPPAAAEYLGFGNKEIQDEIVTLPLAAKTLIIGNTTWHMTRRNMLTSRITMSLLIIKEHIGAIGT